MLNLVRGKEEVSSRLNQLSKGHKAERISTHGASGSKPTRQGGAHCEESMKA